MPGKIKIAYLISCLGLIFNTASAQDEFIDAIQKKFDRYNQQAYIEKIYLNTDRNNYIAGEIAWFKLYIVNGVTNNISNVSKIAYVELLDNTNQIFLQAKINTASGAGNGSFYLPANIPSGSYKIRSYTNWMKNFDANFFFETTLTIINTGNAGNILTDTTALYTINFFPEGGNLTQNIENNIAFKVTDKSGAGINACTGIITNGNDTILRFIPFHAGIGTFLLTPLKGHSYIAHILDSAGNEIAKQVLPPASEGFTMHLKKTSSEQITATIKSSTATENGKALYLFAHTKGAIKSIQKAVLQSGIAQFNIDETKLGEGITHFTIFNSAKKPICERLYFKRPGQKLIINISGDAEAYSARKKAGLQISTTNNKKEPVPANMSLAIYRIDPLQKETGEDIFNYLWLRADLVGHIENPAYYFASITDSTTIGLDNLMLTHGWRRFKWNDIQQDEKPYFEFLPEFEGQIITGKIIDISTKKPLQETVVYASVPGQHTQFYSSLSDKNGNIKFYTKNIVGPGELVVQSQELDNQFYNIEINTPFSGKFSTTKISDFNISPALKTAIEANSISAQVQRKYAADLLKKYNLPDIDTSTFYGKADERYILDDYTRFSTMEEVLREYIPGVIVGRSNRKFRLSIFDFQNKRLFKDNALLLMDGVVVQDADRIMKYDPLKVRKIEVVTRRYYYGPLVVDGIVNFITYKGIMEEFEMDPRSVILDFEGMQLQREFYMPTYNSDEEKNSRLADFRNLLYWEPNVITNKNGEMQLQFYTSDIKGKYIGVIEGISTDGRAGKSTYTFEVK